MAFLTLDQLKATGFKYLGENVLISEKASIYGAKNISIGDFSRIDDFCILSTGEAGITIGRYVHISCYTSLIGQAAITVGDYANVSGRTSIYSSSDDFSGAVMTGPLVGPAYTNVRHSPVTISRHVIIGAGSTILPGITLHEGAAIGAMSLVTKDCEPFNIYAGVPARLRTTRQRNLLDMERLLLRSTSSDTH